MDSKYIWDTYYKTNNHRLIYPDENLVRIIEKQDLTNLKSALDFGCGGARHLIYLKQKNLNQLYGLDYSLEIIKKNQSLFKEIQFIHYQNETSLPFIDNFFDIIICWGVLHYNHSKIRKFLLGEFYRILKKDGIFIGTYRAKQDTHFIESEVHNSEIYFFDDKEVYQELSIMNFNRIQIGYNERTPLGNLDKRIAHYFFLCKK